MGDIIKFPEPTETTRPDDLTTTAAYLLDNYTGEQIILALFQQAVDADDIAALMPSFSVIVDKQDK